MLKKVIALTLIFIQIFSVEAFAKTIAIKLTPDTIISTSKDKYQEGDNITLKTTEDIFNNKNLIIKKGTIAEGLITSLKPNDFVSVPAEIYAEQFKIKDINGKILHLNGIIDKKGRDHHLFNQFLPFIIGFERGGEVFITPNKDIFTLYLEVQDD